MRPTPAWWSAACVAVLALLAAAAVLAVVAPAWYRFHPHMPWQDTLPLLRALQPLLEQGPSADRLWQLLQPHYTAHRVLVPRLLLLADSTAGSGQSHLLYASGLLGIALVAWCFLRLAQRHPLGGSALTTTGALAVVYLFSPAQLWNFINPINSSWPLSIGLALFALYLLLKPGASAPRVAAALLVALLAAFSNFAGLLVWLLMPLALILRRHRFALASVLLSAVVLGLYLRGIHTDAETAITMAANTPANTELKFYADMARRLQAENHPLRVLSRSVHTLGWPLIDGRRALATGLVLASFALLAGAWLDTARRWRRKAEPARPWMEFSLLGATLCLGAAASTHLGRVLPYPDVEHAASAARYQSYVAIYWLCISGVAMAWRAPRDGRASPVVMVAMLALAAALVLLPRAGYLDRELRSAEYAAMLFTVGESEALRPRRTPLGLPLTPDHVLAFERFFAGRGLAWHAARPVAPPAASLPSCDEAGLHLGPGDAPLIPMHAPLAATRLAQLEARIDGWRAGLTREILLFDAGGRLGARLYPHYGNDFPAWPAAGAPASAWLATVPAPVAPASVALTVALPGAGLACRLQ